MRSAERRDAVGGAEAEPDTAAGAEVPAPDSATLAAIAEATGLEPLKDVVMRDLKNKGDAEAEETRSIPERVDEFFR